MDPGCEWKFQLTHWDDPGTPNRLTGGVFYSNWPSPARVKGVYLQYSGFNIICQNPDVKLVVEMMVEPIRQSCQCIPAHLTCTCPHVLWFMTWESCTILMPRTILLNTKIGQLFFSWRPHYSQSQQLFNVLLNCMSLSSWNSELFDLDRNFNVLHGGGSLPKS